MPPAWWQGSAPSLGVHPRVTSEAQIGNQRKEGKLDERGGDRSRDGGGSGPPPRLGFHGGHCPCVAWCPADTSRENFKGPLCNGPIPPRPLNLEGSCRGQLTPWEAGGHLHTLSPSKPSAPFGALQEAQKGNGTFPSQASHPTFLPPMVQGAAGQRPLHAPAPPSLEW